METSDVLILGAGPVGLTLALELQARSVNFFIVSVSGTPMPKCQTTNARSMEHFRQLGISEKVRMSGLPIDHNRDVTYMSSVTGFEFVRYKHSTAKEILSGKRGNGSLEEFWPVAEPGHRIAQTYLEPILKRALAERGDIVQEWRAEKIWQDENFVYCQCTNVSEVKIFRAQYLAACDGGHSLVRSSLSIKMEGIPYIATYKSSFFRSADLRELISSEREAWMYRIVNPNIQSILLDVNGDDLWLLHQKISHNGEKFSLEKALEWTVGEKVSFNVIREEKWTGRALVAERFWKERIGLVGDAAHLWIPWGGFGMNCGIEDAVNLAWKLWGVVNGWLPPDILVTYEMERKYASGEVAKAASRMFEAYDASVRIEEIFGAANFLDPVAGASLRESYGNLIKKETLWEFDSLGLQLGICYLNSPIFYPVIEQKFSVDEYKPRVSPGCRLPHFWISDGQSIYDELGLGFSLLCFVSCQNVITGFELAFELRKVPLKVVPVSAIVPDAFKSSDFVLVRPDNYISWCGKRTDGKFHEIVSKVTLNPVMFKM